MSLRWSFASLAALALIAAMAVVARDAFAPPRRNVVFLTVDSLRADAVSPELTPCLWSAAQGGARFGAHRAVSAWTAPNVIAILTGLAPFAQGVHTRGNSVPAEWEVPLERLAAKGWRVAGTQAFMRADQYRNLGVAIEDDREPLAWLAAQALNGTPFVFWFHYVDVHLPYNPEPPFRPDWRGLVPAGDAAAAARIEAVTRLPALPSDAYRFPPTDRAAIRALYDGNVRQFDSWFCGFWSFLERSRLLRDTLVVLTSDHGEELGERGAVGHASTTRDATLFEEVVRIPLLLWGPGIGGREIVRPTDHLDIMPTALAFLHQELPIPSPGRNLLAPDIPPRPWRALTSKAGFGEKDSFVAREFLAAVAEERWKAILRLRDDRVAEASLFDLKADPAERRERAAENADMLAMLAPPLLAETLARHRPEIAFAPVPTPAAIPRPRWLFPARDSVIRHADVREGVKLRWSGAAGLPYVIQYRAGEGALTLAGEMDVTGTMKDFGIIDRKFWDTFVVPYGVFRLRVGVKGAKDSWSDWVEVQTER